MSSNENPGDAPYWALKSLWSLTKRSASVSSPAGADDSAGGADVELGVGSSEADDSAEAVGSAAEALDSAEEEGSSEADDAPAEGSGTKMPELIDEMGLAVAEAEAEAETEDGAALMLAEAEGRVQARFLAMGVPNAGAARARTGKTVNRVENFIVNCIVVWCGRACRCVIRRWRVVEKSVDRASSR